MSLPRRVRELRDLSLFAFLFERLFRSPSAVEQQTPGAGLGLTIALAIVEAHAGTIEVVSSGPEGTTFRMTFPLRKAGGDEAS